MLATFALCSAAVQARTQPDTAMVFVAENLARGDGNWFVYYRFSSMRLQIRAGDALEYTILMDPKNPVAKGGVDVDFADSDLPLRDLGLLDQNGVRAHGDGLLGQAVGQWYKRRIDISKAAGRTARSWNLVFEGDEAGRYAQFVDDVAVMHADGSRTWIYQSGLPTDRELLSAEGYSKFPSMDLVATASLSPANIEQAISGALARAARRRAFDELRQDVGLVRQFAARSSDRSLTGYVESAARMLQAAEANAALSEPEQKRAIEAARRELARAAPAMAGYRAHLVGYAHIDLQWLWEWHEAMVAARDTFSQALKFTDEFPGFTFSQSSPAFYMAMQAQYPELFAQIKRRVQDGRLELLGGRICEADTNTISSESHARQYLYGQRYFREAFGRTAQVSWEPDSFGHTAQMPQMAKLGGTSFYYFCRAGKGEPLFWWQGLDGTRILAFEETATNSWYNSPLEPRNFQEMLDFEAKTGSKQMLFVYGVGNHGGGPTREDLNQAKKWMADPVKPKVEFSTAQKFFESLQPERLKLPVISQDLNTVFEGCYTSHAEIKRLNRDAEAETTSAETIAAVAAFQGFEYPRAALRRSWTDICTNQHHDTAGGSGTHPGYERTKTVFRRVISDAKDIQMRALDTLAIKVTPKPGGLSVIAFNPLGWTRSGWVQAYLVQSGWNGGEAPEPSNTLAEAPDGKTFPVEVLERPSKLVRFWAGDVPPFGYKVFRLRAGIPSTADLKNSETPQAFQVETARWKLTFDRSSGSISSLVDKRLGRELVKSGGSMGRIEANYEKPAGMSAWTIGPIDRVETLKTTSSELGWEGGSPVASFRYELPGYPGTWAVQKFVVPSADGPIRATIDCNWTVVGTPQQPNPMLRLAFDSALENPTATYQVPFGAVQRPLDGKEYPALQWADLSTPSYGVSILNDSKHGYSVSGSTMKLSLIRSSFDPDPVPNPGLHQWKYEIYPHAGDWRAAQTSQRAAELNQPLLSATVPFNARGESPLEWTPLRLDGLTAVPTALKRAEDDSSLVVRFFEGTGRAGAGSVRFNFPAGRSEWVNFLEDSLAVAGSGQTVPVSLRPYQISTLKIGMADARPAGRAKR